MIQKNIEAFVKWYLANREGNGANYLANAYKNDEFLFIKKIVEYSLSFEEYFGFNPFSLNLSEFQIEFIESIEKSLDNKNTAFEDFNRRNGNGLPRAIFGKKNYLLFLDEIYYLNLEEKKNGKNINSVTKLPFRQEFISFLKDEQDYSSGSSNDYATYVVQANKNILTQSMGEDFLITFSELLEKNDVNAINKHFEIGLTHIIKCDNKTSKSKYKSGFLEYQNFVNTEILSDNFDFEEELDDDSRADNNEIDTFVATKLTKEEREEFDTFLNESVELEPLIFLDKEAIIKNFYFRLTTQDRLYGDIYYPIGLMKKLFSLNKENKKYFDNLINNQINKIKIHSEEGSINLNSISSLTIIPRHSVHILKDESNHQTVFTEDGYESNFKPMKVGLFKEIAIDHITPMKDLLIAHSDKLPKLKSITDLLKNEGISGTGKELLKSVRQVGNRLIEKEVLGSKDIEELKIELEFLDSLSEFQLMDWKENLKKNKIK